MTRGFAVVCALVAVGIAAPAFGDCDATPYGAGVTLAESTPVEAVLDRPDDFVAKTIRIEGTVSEVCQMMGCWLEIRAAAGERVLRVKVKDGEIVFPTSARGLHAVAQGVVERVEMDRAQYVRQAAHHAEEQGKPFDETSIGEGPFSLVQVKGTGAQICKAAAPAS